MESREESIVTLTPLHIGFLCCCIDCRR